MYENSNVSMYHIYSADSLFSFLCFYFYTFFLRALCKERLCNLFFFSCFFFVNYFKEKLVLFVEKISGKGNVRKRTMREDEVSCRVTKCLAPKKKQAAAKKQKKNASRKLSSKWSSFTGDGVSFGEASKIFLHLDAEVGGLQMTFCEIFRTSTPQPQYITDKLTDYHMNEIRRYRDATRRKHLNDSIPRSKARFSANFKREQT
jgi:hypothetical protein